jgi:ABC-type nitrate/sulfonate/bicarbonate transport system substrate-binding protein
MRQFATRGAGLVCVVAALLGGAAQRARAQPLQKITINFPTRSASSWPLFMAKEGGFYKKYGLDATLVFGIHPAGIAMVVSSEAQMTNYSLETAMQAMARDGSLVVVGSPLNKATFALMARKDIPNVQALKGKRIGVGQIGDAPSNYAIELLKAYGLTSRDIQWVALGGDANGRAAALEAGRVDATMLTAPAYFKMEERGYRSLANLADHDEIFASTTYLMKKTTVAANPKLPELLIRAQAEAIKRFYEDKDFAVRAYMVYDPQSRADVERFYDIHFKGNLFERVPYVMAGAVKSVVDEQTDPQLVQLMKGYDYRKVVDNSYVDRLVKEGFFEKLFGPGIKAEEDRKAKLAFR